MIDHSNHGRGANECGPDEEDCPCRATSFQYECASNGCGFCICAIDDEVLNYLRLCL
jgi:hypothetical protein